MSTQNGNLEDNAITNNSRDFEGNDNGENKGKVKLLRSRKKCGKTRLTEARNHLNALINNGPSRASKTKVRAGIQKVSYEFDIIKKIITSLIEVIALGEGGGEEIEEKDINAVI